MGVEPISTGLQPVAWPSGSSAQIVARPGIEPGLRPSHGRVPPTHSQAILSFQVFILMVGSNDLFPWPSSVPRQGIEPRPADSKSAVPSVTLARHPHWLTAGRSSRSARNRTLWWRFWRPPACPEAHCRRRRVSDGNRTRTSCFTGRRACPLHFGYHAREMKSRRSETDTAWTRLFSSVERRGVEPRLSGCKPEVFPLDQRPLIARGPSGVRTRSSSVPSTRAAGTLTDQYRRPHLPGQPEVAGPGVAPDGQGI